MKTTTRCRDLNFSFSDFQRLPSERLRNLIELVALDDIAFLVFVEFAEADAALEGGADFFDFFLEPAEGGHPAIEDRDAAADDAGVGLAVDAAVGDE